MAVLVAVYLVYGLLSAGTYTDDDIAHYLIARSAWRHPGLFFHSWGRPAFTILYAPVALLGFPAVRAFSALIAGAVCFLAARAAGLYGLKRPWLAALLTGLQPEFVKQAFSSLTELTFVLLLAGALVAWRKRSWAWMAFLAGWMPLARYESVPIAIVFAVLLLRERRPALFLLLAAPFLAHNVYHAIRLANWPALFFPLDHALGIRPGTSSYSFAPGHPLHYVALMPRAFGWIAVVLAAWGALRLRFGLVHLFFLLAVLVVSFVHWRLPKVGIPPGWPLYLSIVCPLVGILAAAGFESLTSRLPSPRGSRLAAAALAAACAVAAVAQVRPFAITPERTLVRDVGRWFVRSDYRDRLVLGSHVWFVFATGLDRYDESVFRPITPDNIASAPVGAIVIWDSHYSHRLQYKTPFKLIAEDPRFRRLRSETAGRFRLFVFEKIPAPPKEGQT